MIINTAAAHTTATRITTLRACAAISLQTVIAVKCQQPQLVVVVLVTCLLIYASAGLLHVHSTDQSGL
jgi:hypothetical protein